MNIVVLMLDSLRPDYLGCGGNKEVKTPNIDKIAEEGIFFENAFAEYPITIPSRTAIVSGTYTFPNRPWCPLRSYDLHIAEILKNLGYYTASFSDTPFNQPAGMDRGFDIFEWIVYGKCHNPPHQKKYNFRECYFPPHASEREKKFYENTMINRYYSIEIFGKSCPELLFEKGVKYIEEAKEPFFLWIDSFEPHEPWCPPEKYEKIYQKKEPKRYIPHPVGPSSDWLTQDDIEHILNLYKGDITHTDEMVGLIYEALKKRNLLEKTMLIIISDHGEPFGEHGTIRKFGVPLYNELSKMVFIIRYPEIIKKKSRNFSYVQNVDILPTILDILGVKIDEKIIKFGGKSLLPVLKGEEEKIREEVYIGAFCLRGGIIKDEYKFINNYGEKENELYNLVNDPFEKNNIINKNQKIAEILSRKLWEFISKWSEALSWRDRPMEGR
jgi:arylsulfatase A-like enzyme